MNVYNMCTVVGLVQMYPEVVNRFVSGVGVSHDPDWVLYKSVRFPFFVVVPVVFFFNNYLQPPTNMRKYGNTLSLQDIFIFIYSVSLLNTFKININPR